MWHASRLRYAEGSWLTTRLVAAASCTALALSVLAVAAGFLTRDGLLDTLGRPLGTDFASFWSAGRLVAEGRAAAAYDWDALQGVQRGLIGTELFFPWNYPPVFLLIAGALGHLDYLPALLLWQGATIGLAWLAFRQVLDGRFTLLVALACPTAFVCFSHGQTGFLSLALLLGGAVALPHRQVLAGVLLGALAFKPQLGVLVPLFLAACGLWRAFASAAATVALFVGATLAAFGPEVWTAFLGSLGTTQAVVLASGGAGFEKFQSVFAWVRLWGGSVPQAYAVHGVVAAAVVALCLTVWRQPVDRRLKAAALLLGTLLVTPYVLDYDMVVLGGAMALLVAHGREHGFRPWLRTLLALAWLLPAMARSINGVVPLPVTPMLLIALLLAALPVRSWLRATPDLAGAAVPAR